MVFDVPVVPKSWIEQLSQLPLHPGIPLLFYHQWKQTSHTSLLIQLGLVQRSNDLLNGIHRAIPKSQYQSSAQKLNKNADADKTREAGHFGAARTS